MGVGCDRGALIAWTRIHVIIDHDTCVKMALSEAIDASSCTTWLHRTVTTHRNFDISWRKVWTLYDSSIKVQTIEIEANRGHQDMGSCPRFVGNVDASEAIDLQRTALIKGDHGQRGGPRSLRFRVIDGPTFITKWTAHIVCRIFYKKIDVFLFSS